MCAWGIVTISFISSVVLHLYLCLKMSKVFHVFFSISLFSCISSQLLLHVVNVPYLL